MESALHRHTTHVAAQPGMQSVLGGSDLTELMTLVCGRPEACARPVPRQTRVCALCMLFCNCNGSSMHRTLNAHVLCLAVPSL